VRGERKKERKKGEKKYQREKMHLKKRKIEVKS
jgi:hypothetical protein